MKKTYTRDFKITACKMVIEDKLNAALVAKNLGVGTSLLYGWIDNYKTFGDEAFVGSGKRRVQDARLAKMEKENAMLRQENDILKKAAAYFTKLNGND